ncbi:MAG TPA: AAA family ATPase, partial [Thermoanaerobaculia bacterium]|nr:AAA family ATPase [Thermoanaerobaculia bacterium]
MAPGPEPVFDRPAIVGREAELARVLGALDEAAAGRGSVWLVEGEAGIGKSRFAEELADRAAVRAVAVHWGRCWEAGGAPAYWPWIQVLRSLLRGGVDGTRLGAQTSSALAPLLPELGAAGGTQARELEPEQARFRLMDAAHGLLCAAGREQPTLVVLEDLHAADPASITMLDFIARQVRDEPLVVVGTFREAEAPREEVAEPLARVARAARAVLRLRALTLEEVAACVARIAGAGPRPRVAAAIHEASEGNPLFAVEIAGLMASQGALDEDSDRVDIMIPASVRAVIRERAAGLDEPTRRLLGAASVIGREFTTSDLAQLVEGESLDLSRELADAARARLLGRGGDGSLGFTHFLVREVFHAALEPERRASLHRRRAEQLLRRLRPGASKPWAELAHHLLEAGPDAADRAAEACVEAAAQANERLAFDDAARFYLCATELLERDPDPDPRRLCCILLDRAQALLQAGSVDQGRRVCRRAADLARSLGDAGLLTRAALTYGSVFVYADVDPTLVELLREALAAAERGDSAVRARLQARLAAALQPAPDTTTAFTLAREAIAMARRVGDRATLLAAIRSGCSALMDLAAPEERLALNREHVALAGELERPIEALRAHMRIVIDALELGDLAAADRAIDACDELSERTGLPHHRWPVRSFRAMRAAMAGRFDDAAGLIEQARRESERARDPNAPRTLELQRHGLLRAREAIDDAWPQPELVAAPVIGGFEALYMRMVAGSHLARHGRAGEVPRSVVERA